LKARRALRAAITHAARAQERCDVSRREADRVADANMHHLVFRAQLVEGSAGNLELLCGLSNRQKPFGEEEFRAHSMGH
jgi:hypothetical protein